MQHVNPANLDAYNQALTTSLDDKLFFAERIPDDVSVFADFGCADGSLLWATMQARFGKPGYGHNVYLGYDHNPDMLRAAERRTNFDPAFLFVGNLPALKARLDALHAEGHKSCLILSSVVHEVLSQDSVTFASFWDVVRDLGCDYVVFRDMALEASSLLERTPTSWYGPAFVREDTADILRALSFEGVHGSMLERANFIHFLLKAVHPLEDWAKELEEDYLPHTAEAYLNLMTIGSGYKLAHYEHTALVALQAKWHAFYGIHVSDKTHLKMILKKGW